MKKGDEARSFIKKRTREKKLAKKRKNRRKNQQVCERTPLPLPSVYYQSVDIKFDKDCPVCNIENEDLVYDIHSWKFSENKTYRDIKKRIDEIYPDLKININHLRKHFEEHFPVEGAVQLELFTRNGEGKVSEYFKGAVEQRVKPANELEDLYGRVTNWLYVFEKRRVREETGELIISRDDLDGFVKLSAELRGILTELNKIKQSNAMAKFCVQGFMSRFIESLLKGLNDEIQGMYREINTRFGGGKELENITNKMRDVWARQIKDSARMALIETCKEFGLK